MIHATIMINGQIDNRPSGKQDPEIADHVKTIINGEVNTRKKENVIRTEHHPPNRILPR